VCQAAAGASPDPAGTKKQIPIFPLNVVALPAAVVPLMIFEARWVL
jgi:Lon protease-like protein